MSNVRTRTGDAGQTDIKDLRVYKDSDIIKLIGDLDETMAHFILCHSIKPEGIKGFKGYVDDLILISGIVSGYVALNEFKASKITDIENEIVERGESFTDFTYPFDDTFKAHMNVLRTVVRRLERQAYRTLKDDDFKHIKIYLNCLSDLVFTYIK